MTAKMADINPLGYRGYYYDSELEMYYLKSRYYDPEICRFINADGYASTGQGFLGCNMFAYCLNNPVNMIDSIGNEPSISHVGRQNGRAPRNNRNQNEQFFTVVKLLKLTYDQARLLHDEISRMGYGYQEILQIARDMFRK